MKNVNWSYLWQPMVAVIYMAAVLRALGHFSDSEVLAAIGATSLASTVLIVVTNPEAETSQIGNIFGGYLVGLVCGICFRFLAIYVIEHLLGHPLMSLELCCALAVGAAIALMAVCGLLHPPAAGMVVGLVMNAWDFYTIRVIGVSVITIVLIKMILKPMIKPLF